MNTSLLRIFAMLVMVLTAGNVSAALIALEYGSTVDNSNHEVTFFIKFNNEPDFFTVDGAGRQADSFQYYVDVDALSSTPEQNNAESIVRGEEIHLYGEIKIRDRYGNDGTDPNSGGWGPILGSLPYILSGDLLSFTAPWSFLKDDDGVFTYQLLLTEYGGMTDMVYGLSGKNYSHVTSAVPLPAAVWFLLPGLAGIFVTVKGRKYA